MRFLEDDFSDDPVASESVEKLLFVPWLQLNELGDTVVVVRLLDDTCSEPVLEVELEDLLLFEPFLRGDNDLSLFDAVAVVCFLDELCLTDPTFLVSEDTCSQPVLEVELEDLLLFEPFLGGDNDLPLFDP